LCKLRDGTLGETPQDAALATYAPMLKKEHGRIDWSRPAREVRNLVRGMTPWPSAYALHAGKTLKVLSSDVAGESGAAGVPGEVVSLGRGGIAVACGEGVLRLRAVQAEGGKAMEAWAYAQGRRVAAGERLS
jgi:methionyl-tRNA formyltransferase